ncbi:MAG TPA: periplasmic heavy metal sensor [Pseudolabrys sp.]|jgi:uncharacterized membrane protein
MTVAHFAPTVARGSTRWLLLGSLALNLFFVGVALAMVIRAPEAPTWDRNVFVRMDRLAATLPTADADRLRGDINSNRQAIETAQTQHRGAQDQIRAVLRKEPFDVNELRAAMTQTRAARQNFDQILQGMFADAASKMSHDGRQALADWPPGRKTADTER